MPRFSNKIFKKRKNIGKPKISVVLPRDVNLCLQNTSPRPSTGSPVDVLHSSSSSRKLSDSKYKDECKENVNEIINISLLSEALAKSVLCISCKKPGMSIQVKRHFGLACELDVLCVNCNNTVTFSSSSHNLYGDNKSKLYDINIRLVYGLRSIGKGIAAGNMLCGIMNLPSPPTKFDTYVVTVGSTVEDVAHNSMKNAIEETVVENCNDPPRDLTVAFDGSWQKRGHQSLNGVVTATCGDNSKVIDVAVLSKYCRCPQRLKNTHTENCVANYSGPSGGMEVEGVKRIYQRSVSWYNARYINYLGDGDSKAFIAVNELKPYGPDIEINKLECIGHIQKRMGTRLRLLKQTYGPQKLSDGKTLGGRNRLTDEAIDRIQRYYGYAIRQNTESVEKMRKAVWALFFHTSSSDENPQHSLCPKGEDTWCKYIKANGNYSHKHTLPFAVMEIIKPIFRDLSNAELLKKCLHGCTQNPNESLNNLIWARIPKRVFVGIKTLHLGVYDAVASYNDGNTVKCEVLEKLGISPGYHMVTAMKGIDQERIRKAEAAEKNLEKLARQKRRTAKRRLQDEMEEDPDCPSYGPGMH